MTIMVYDPKNDIFVKKINNKEKLNIVYNTNLIPLETVFLETETRIEEHDNKNIESTKIINKSSSKPCCSIQ